MRQLGDILMFFLLQHLRACILCIFGRPLEDTVHVALAAIITINGFSVTVVLRLQHISEWQGKQLMIRDSKLILLFAVPKGRTRFKNPTYSRTVSFVFCFVTAVTGVIYLDHVFCKCAPFYHYYNKKFIFVMFDFLVAPLTCIWINIK